MPHLARFFALLLVFMMTPGATEIVENAAHLVADGHTAHAIDDADHTPVGNEHGCTGAIHLCACHSSASFLAVDVRPLVSSPVLLDALPPESTPGHPTLGHARGVFRPPLARA